MSALTLALDDQRWLEFVGSREEATPFHDPSWAKLLADCYSFEGRVVALVDPSAGVIAGLPVLDVPSIAGRRRWVSLPFTDRCAPLGDEARLPELTTAIVLAAQSAGRRAVEIRAPLEGTAGTVVGFEHVLPLERDLDAVKATFSRSQVTRNIARSKREGVSVRRGADSDDLLGVFYGLHLRTRRRQGVPIQPRRFFRLLWDRLLASGRGAVFVAEIDGQPVAAAVFLGWKRTLVYKFGASDVASWPRRPNHALFWEAIQWACAEGYQRLDFGRTDLDNEGLRAFKAGWGTFETPLVYSTLGGAGRASSAGRLGGALSAVIKRSPENFCRFLGERLYRYAG